jgi:hypothetical protein
MTSLAVIIFFIILIGIPVYALKEMDKLNRELDIKTEDFIAEEDFFCNN